VLKWFGIYPQILRSSTIAVDMLCDQLKQTPVNETAVCTGVLMPLITWRAMCTGNECLC